MGRIDRAVGIIVSALGVAAGTLYGLGAQYHVDSPAESHTLFHWGAGAASGAGALLVVVFLFWPTYAWAIEYRTRWQADLHGRPSLRIPLIELFSRGSRGSPLEIVRATYGREDRGIIVDVTDAVRAHVKDGQLSMSVALENLGVRDPLYGVVKELVITYRARGKTPKIARFTETFPVRLP